MVESIQSSENDAGHHSRLAQWLASNPALDGHFDVFILLLVLYPPFRFIWRLNALHWHLRMPIGCAAFPVTNVLVTR